MGKSTHFSGQPLYSQIIKLLDKSEILRISSEQGAERYVKSFDAWTHLLVMLYAVIMRFDSLREITASLQAEACKLRHLGIFMMTSRSTLADGNKRRSEAVFEAVYRDLYAKHRHLWRECQCHQDTDLGNVDRQPAAHDNAEEAHTLLELFGVGHNGQDNTDVLCGFLQPL